MSPPVIVMESQVMPPKRVPYLPRCARRPADVGTQGLPHRPQAAVQVEHAPDVREVDHPAPALVRTREHLDARYLRMREIKEKRLRTVHNNW